MILVCAATGTEAAACRRGIADAGAPRIEVTTTGVGPERAAQALRRWLARHPTVRPEPFDSGGARDASARDRLRAAESKGVTLIVSSGFAGALTPGIVPLSWVTASALYRIVDGRAIPVALARGLLRFAEGALACQVVSAGHVVVGAVAGLTGPAAADMESAALAEVAGAAGLPFLVLRLVTDTPARPLPTTARSLTAALAARGVARRATYGARAALEAACSPARTAAFVRDTLVWRERLRLGWREQARRGVPTSAREDLGPP